MECVTALPSATFWYLNDRWVLVGPVPRRAGRPGDRRRSAIRLAGWLGSVLLALLGVGLVWGPDAVPPPLHDHPVRTHAVITDLYINGVGGDEVADYKYVVDGHTYFGFGPGGELGNGDIFSHNPGDAIIIEYAATRPALSCSCDAS